MVPKMLVELKEFSDKFKMPLVSSVLGKGIVEDEFPAYMGSIGRLVLSQVMTFKLMLI